MAAQQAGILPQPGKEADLDKFLEDVFFSLLVLDKAICPFLAKTFDLSFFHPICERAWTHY